MNGCAVSAAFSAMAACDPSSRAFADPQAGASTNRTWFAHQRSARACVTVSICCWLDP